MAAVHHGLPWRIGLRVIVHGAPFVGETRVGDSVTCTNRTRFAHGIRGPVDLLRMDDHRRWVGRERMTYRYLCRDGPLDGRYITILTPGRVWMGTLEDTDTGDIREAVYYLHHELLEASHVRSETDILGENHAQH